MRLALGFLVKARLNIRPPETAMPTACAARWQLIPISP